MFFVGVEGKGWETRHQFAKHRLERAGALAGLEEIVVADEALASLAHEHRVDGVLVGLDFGGGTFDVKVLEQTSSDRKLLATHGAAIGTEPFDPSSSTTRCAAGFGSRRPISTLARPCRSRRA